MATNLFSVMKLLSEANFYYTVRVSSPYCLTITVVIPGKRVEIGIDEEDNMIDVSVFRGSESVEVGLDAVRKVLQDD